MSMAAGKGGRLPASASTGGTDTRGKRGGNHSATTTTTTGVSSARTMAGRARAQARARGGSRASAAAPGSEKGVVHLAQLRRRKQRKQGRWLAGVVPGEDDRRNVIASCSAAAGAMGAGDALRAGARWGSSVADFRGGRSRSMTAAVSASSDDAAGCSDAVPLLVRAARGESVERPPAWMMRQAGRYMRAYRDLANKYPSFRMRSETTELAVETTLQPFEAFRPDGVILFSDILTPLPAIGVPFEIDDIKGPVLERTVRDDAAVAAVHAIDLEYLTFVGDALKILKREVSGSAALLGFVGSPWTLATYVVEGGTSRLYETVKNMCYTNSPVLHALLQKLADAVAEYVCFQIESGADCVQIFDSWGGQLPPVMWDVWSKPYVQSVVRQVRQRHPRVPLALYVNGSGGLLERMAETEVDVIGLDWTVDIGDARRRMGDTVSVQGNVDPTILFTSKDSIEEAIRGTVERAGNTGHILNLGHGVLVGTPEENVAHFFDTARNIKLQ